MRSMGADGWIRTKNVARVARVARILASALICLAPALLQRRVGNVPQIDRAGDAPTDGMASARRLTGRRPASFSPWRSPAVAMACSLAV
jgi:hypothetical protein